MLMISNQLRRTRVEAKRKYELTIITAPGAPTISRPLSLAHLLGLGSICIPTIITAGIQPYKNTGWNLEKKVVAWV